MIAQDGGSAQGNDAAQSCTITAVSPADHSTRLRSGAKNVTADCSCGDNEDNAPDGSKVLPIAMAPPNTPYFTNNSFPIARLIIPVFNDTYKGNYTCKPRGDDSSVSILQLLLGE